VATLANDRLEKRADGRYVLRLKTRWRDGTTHLLFEPIELMERLAAQIPKPRSVSTVLLAASNISANMRSRFIATTARSSLGSVNTRWK
jgi:hypothetical protein